MKRKICILSLLLFCCCFFSVGVAAMDGTYAESAANSLELQASTYVSPHNGLKYEIPSPVVALGIDVSSWNGVIDWQKVANHGVKFALVRVGHTNWGGENPGYSNPGDTVFYPGVTYEDPNFRKNIEGARANGIKVGVYVYSQATSTDEAIAEADFVLSRIKDYELDLPVVLDYEFGGASGKLRDFYGTMWPDSQAQKRAGTDICVAFCKYVAEQGYSPMVYANGDMLKNYLYADEIEAVGNIWMANWPKAGEDEVCRTVYHNDFDFWQYTSTGKVNGINSNVDCNFCFVNSLFLSDFPFKDVSLFHWAYNDVKYCKDNGLMEGTALDLFAPNVTLSRGMVVTILYRLAGSPEVSGSSSFTDFKQDWYRKPVLWANLNGIVKGYDSTHFGPEDSCTREQTAAIFHRYYKLTGHDGVAEKNRSFKDESKISSYALNDVYWAIGEGLLKGFDDNTLRPQDSVSRCQTASILTRYIKKFNL